MDMFHRRDACCTKGAVVSVAGSMLTIIPPTHPKCGTITTMNTFFRSSVLSLCAVLATIALSVAISLLAVHNTAMRESNVKQWLVAGEVYTNNPLSVFIKPSIDLPPGIIAQFNLQASDLTGAIDAAFPPQFLQQHTEHSVDALYAWLRGETDNLAVSVPVPERRDIFVAELTKILQPRVAALPVCTPGMQSTVLCRSANDSVESLSARLASSAATNSTLFEQPLELSLNTTTSPATSAAPTLPVSNLPGTFQAVRPMIIGSFIIFLLCVVITYFCCTKPLRPVALTRLARRLTFSLGFSAFTIYFVAYLLGNGTLNLPGTAAPFVPFLRIALADILSTYGLYTLIAAAIAAAAWAGLGYWQKQQPQPTLPATPQPPYPQQQY